MLAGDVWPARARRTPKRRRLSTASFFFSRKPAAILDQAAQILDLTGVARVAVDDAGETDA